MRTRFALLGCALVVIACACAESDLPKSPESGAYAAAGDGPPGRRAAPAPPFSTKKALLVDRVEEALERYDKDRWERWVDAVDAGELAKDLRLGQEAIDAGRWKVEWLFANGDEIFEHDFGAHEGFGPGLKRVHEGAKGGPDALSCAECHHRGGFDGAGDRSQNEFFDGNGKDPATAFERNAPHTLGLGAVERLAAEMTADLRFQRDNALANARVSKKPWVVKLSAKGVSFGEITANPDGTVDDSRLAGVEKDLVVRPFGWKGSLPTLREFAADGFQRHHGIQVADASGDSDADGYWYELSDGMLTSVTVYLSLLEVPVMIPPRDPALLARHADGALLFRETGCASCHVPSLALHDTKIRIGKTLTADLLVDAEEPRLQPDAFGRLGAIEVPLYSDLKRHRMGAALSEGKPTVQGIPGDVFLTRPLWGLADTAPFLHDGRAATLDEAILLHGGEAQAARDRFAALSSAEKGDLRIFLTSLTRYPRVEMR